ncbi:MAG: LysR family transcriptional regulator [Pseudomonadota bacterium]
MAFRTDRLQLRDFRLLLAIEETGQLRLAAERLGLAQPAASRMLAAIERELEAPAFERHPKGMTPTPVGKALIRHAFGLLSGVQQAMREVDAVRAGRAGIVRVGAVTGGAVAFLTPAIRELKRSSDGADVYVDVANSDALIEGLLQGDYDFVLARLPSGLDLRRVEATRALTESVRFLARRGHPLEAERGAPLARLTACEWVVQGPKTPIRRAIEERLIQTDARAPEEFVNTSSLLMTITYLLGSDAIAPASREVADTLAPDGGRLVILDIAEEIVLPPYYVLRRSDRVLSPTAQLLERIVRDTIDAKAPGTAFSA